MTGCTKVSPGCAHCYAEAITLRFKRGGPFLPGKTTVYLHPDRLRVPISWKRPRRIFVNSMSDLFHEDIPLSFVLDVFSVMNQAKHHIFQILTKRPQRLLAVADLLSWPKHVWIGVSVENQLWADRRVPLLKRVPAAIRFVSCEPLLKPIDLSHHLDGVDWVIVGGESGPGLGQSWRSGFEESEMTVRLLASHFSSSSGGVGRAKLAAGFWTAKC